MEIVVTMDTYTLTGGDRMNDYYHLYGFDMMENL